MQRVRVLKLKIKASNEEINSFWNNAMSCDPVDEIEKKKQEVKRVTIFRANFKIQIVTP